MNRPSRILLALGLLVLGGCASTAPNPRADGPEPPRVRCLAEPHETATRPLIFLFCIQSP